MSQKPLKLMTMISMTQGAKHPYVDKARVDDRRNAILDRCSNIVFRKKCLRYGYVLHVYASM